jgi:hypothetical protein
MNNRENIEQMLARNELDYIRIDENTTNYGGISLVKNNKCGKITVSSDGITTSPFDTIELLYLEEQGRNVTHSGTSPFIPMYQDFFVVCSSRQFIRRQQNNDLDFDGYCTIGAGIYYERTQYTINEDDEYFYITAKFDIYTNTVLDSISNFYNGMSSDHLLSSVAPRFKEEDTEWDELRVSIQETQTRQTNQRMSRTTIPSNFRNHRRIRSWLSTNRVPNIRRNATDESRDCIVRTPNGLTTCVAIKKVNYTEPTSGSLNLGSINSGNGTIGLNSWIDFDSWNTTVLNIGMFNERNTRSKLGVLNDANHIVTTNTFSKRKNDKMFKGIFENNGRYTIANIVCTDSGTDDEELLRLLKSKMATNVYPETNKKVLLNKNAFLRTYIGTSLEDNIVNLPGIIGSELTLVREGDFDGTQGGSTLGDNGQLEGGVYKIRLSHSSTLRRDKMVATINNGTYRVCTGSDMDIIQYVDAVSDALDKVMVEANRGRLTMETGSSQTLRVSRRNRKLSTDAGTIETPTKKISVRRSARKIFGDFLRLESLEEE